MTLTRRDRLQTLGLWPIWKLRSPAPAALEVSMPDSQTLTETNELLPPPPLAERKPPSKPIDILQPAAPSEDVTPSPILDKAACTDQTGSPPLHIHSPEHTNAVMRMDWNDLHTAIHACTRCPLARTRTHAVPGMGDIHADWLFIGEAPGAREDQLGEPFVGDAGQLLDAMMAAIGLRRGDQVYIANVLKSRPPCNRDPQPQEVAACLPFLERQIELIQPKLIVALGRFAAQNLLATNTPIGQLRGHVHRYRGVPLVVTYHPAYLLRNPLDKAKVWEDLVLARRTMNELKHHTDFQ